jgi:hypothetical protein
MHVVGFDVLEQPIERLAQALAADDGGVDHERVGVEGPHRELAARQLDGERGGVAR